MRNQIVNSFERRNRNQGSIVVESLLLVPVLMLFVLLVVYTGRWTTSAHHVSRVADVAARAASQVSLSKMVKTGRIAAAKELKNQNSDCVFSNVEVTPYATNDVSFVRVVVSCVMKTVDLGLLNLPARRVSATSVEVIDVYTSR